MVVGFLPLGSGQDMLTHSQIWAALDALAAREGLTPSSLARLAGLDPTTFNRSKRQNSEGQLRWPSTESIAKVLAATGASVDEFLLMIARTDQPVRRVPFRTLGKTAEGWFDAKGQPAAGWDEIAFPAPEDRTLFALEIRGDEFLPVFREGDTIIVAPETQTRRGDRVFLLDQNSKIGLAVLERQTATHLHLSSLQGEALPPLALKGLRLVARIIWASQ